MRIRIDINLDNSAFDDSPSVEVARILAKLGSDFLADSQDINEAIEDPVESHSCQTLLKALYDSNGNCVGAVDLLYPEKTFTYGNSIS